MVIATRTPEGEHNRCPVCGAAVVIEPSRPPGDAPCPSCGHLLWFYASPRLRVVCRRVGAESSADAPFEAQRWRSGSLAIRGAMSRDLARRELLVGRSSSDLRAILGEPDEKGEGWWCYCLYLGVRITYRGSPHRLRVSFDRCERVSWAVVEEKPAP